MIKEHDSVILTSDVPDEGLRIGDVGVVVHIHNKGEAFEVEFMTLAGKTVTVKPFPLLLALPMVPQRSEETGPVAREGPRGAGRSAVRISLTLANCGLHDGGAKGWRDRGADGVRSDASIKIGGK